MHFNACVVATCYADAAAGSISVTGAMLRNGSRVDIFCATPWLRCAICSWMHMRKVSEDHLPIFLIVSRSMPLSLAAMAPPARSEWLPTFLLLKPWSCMFRCSTANWTALFMSLLIKWCFVLFLSKHVPNMVCWLVV